MGKSLLKDILREIVHTRKRFLSLFLIVLMGVGVFAGIKATSSDMKLTEDKYADDYNFMDIQIMSTMGLTKNDVDKIKSVKGVQAVEPAYSLDAVVNKGNKGVVIKVHGIDFEKAKRADISYINKPKLLKGRFPINNTECVVEEKFLKDLGYSIGDIVSLTLDSDNQKNLKNNKFKIVGVVETPYYISRDRGSSTVGNGQIQAFMMIPESVFSMDYYTESYIIVNNAKKLFSYSDEYDNLIKSVKDDLIALGKKQCDIRFNDIKNQAQKKINDAKKELETNENIHNKELLDAKNKIDKASIKLAASKKELNDNLLKYNEQISNGEKQISEGKKQINQSLDKLVQSEKELNNAQVKLDDTVKQLNYDANIKALNEKYNELQNAIVNINEQINKDPSLKASLEPKLQELNVQCAVLSKQMDVLNSNKQKLDAESKQLAEQKKQLENSKEKLVKSQNELALQEKELNISKIEGQKKLDDARVQINNGEKELNNNIKKYDDSKKEFEKQINDAKNKITESEKELNDLKKPIWYVLDRKSNIGFVEFGDEADRIKAIGNVFPTIFFLVAALVSLTTMTRMVEEQRTQMGLMKALGYGKFTIMLKFIIYSVVPTLLGSIVGLLLGFNILPRVIMGAYNMMYTLPPVITEFNLYYAFLGTIAALISTTLVAIIVSYNILRETPASLMRLKAPAAGKRVLLEKVNIIWSRLSFIQKVTARNIFRYKKRFLMTVLGIGGCTALLLTGFGIRDSISIIAVKQYNEIFKYQMVTTFKSDASKKDITKLLNTMKDDDDIKESMLLSQLNIDVRNGDIKKSVFLVVPDNTIKFKNFVLLKNRIDGKKIYLNDNGIVITEKLANMLGVKTGEYIYIKNESKEVKVKVSGIAENYVQHYVYMTLGLYKKLFHKNPVSNEIISKLTNSSKSIEDDLSLKLLKSPIVLTINFTSSIKKTFQDVINNLLSIVLVFIVSAGSLAFVVLYNLTNINITERIRELATMKVLGFYDIEVSSYLMRENAILTFIGIILGFIFGIYLHRYVMATSEVDILMFGRSIKPLSYLYAAFMTVLFSVIVSVVIHFQLKKIDMVDSLKSPDD